MRAPAAATASAVRNNWSSHSTAHGPAITTKSFPPISMSRTCTSVRERLLVSVFATRSKQENCPFHFGFMSVAILVSGECVGISGNLLASRQHTAQAAHSAVLSLLYRVGRGLLVISVTLQRDGAHKFVSRDEFGVKEGWAA